MGYAPGVLGLLLHMIDQGHLPEKGSILELGNQELIEEVQIEEIRDFMIRLNPNYPHDDKDISAFSGCFSGKVLEAAGFSYKAIDLFRGYNTVEIDLNYDDLPAHLRGQFDLVTNFGTTEHLSNQVKAFQTIHDALKVGGLSIHQVPFAGYVNHGLIKYEPKFFERLAVANHYELICLNVGKPEYNEQLAFFDDHITNSSLWNNLSMPSGIMTVIYLKRDDMAFRPPLDLDPRHCQRMDLP